MTQEYHRTRHSEIGCTPLERYLAGPNAARECPGERSAARGLPHRGQTSPTPFRRNRQPRGQRFEIPSRYRQLTDLRLRYARWDLTRVDLIDPHSGAIFCPVHPIDKAANAEGIRRVFEPISHSPKPPSRGIAPLLKKMIADYAATGLPPAYLPTPPEDPDMNQKLLALYGLKFNPFIPEVPIEALHVSPKIENFCWRIEQAHLREGGFALVHGDPGSGKSVVMRVLAERLSRLADLIVGVMHHPQSNL